ncbi:MAG: hypothetical protein C0506_03300 [Anaerolinea sp.]|nr:hypothetical protein [Anaerolinea sp.]
MVKREPYAFGQLRIEFDVQTPVVHGPAATGEERRIEAREDALREWVRDDALGRYRPLPTARTMRPGWYVRCEPGFSLDDALEVIYPLAVRHQRMLAEGTLRLVSLQRVFDRQSGRYRAAGKLSAAGREAARRVLCNRCVKVPLWDGETAGSKDIPCPEPCSLMLSLCREAALWEEAPPAPAPIDPSVAWAAFDEPGNEIRETYLRERSAPANEVGLLR